MDRQIIYPGQIPLETDLLNTNKNTMIAVAKLAAALLGTATVVNGLATVPTSPASLQVNVNPGEMYSLANVDATAYSSVPADTAHSILKQGISLDAVTLSCPAPVTAGQSVNYLIQASYSDSDQGLVTLPYYNASNPSQAWSGPGNSGAQQATVRKGIVNISAKAGVAATTGSQTTPAPDAGYTGLYVVTVANGQSTITAANITQAANAPILPTDLLHAIQANSLVTAVDTGSANTYVVSFSPAVTALTDGMVLWFKAKTANTGASTLNVNGLGASPMVGGAHSALQGGEIVANGKACAVWRADISSWVLLKCTGGAVQVGAGSASNHAPNMSQVSGIAGAARNLAMSVPSASATATLTADEIVVETALGGVRYCLANFSQAINLGTTGAGGMDTGSAPANGYVALYAAYNPTTNARTIFAQNATAGAVGNVYGGVNAPAGYTATALVSVWRTNGSGQLVAGFQVGRVIGIAATQAFTTNGTVGSPTPVSVSGIIPANAKAVTSGSMQAGSTATSTVALTISGHSSHAGGVSASFATNSAQAYTVPMPEIQILTPQTIYYTSTNTAGTPTFIANISGYRI
ncbi:hypothetical protein [Cupriavidus taiwanensis]|uniref:hypothetical protein n=1 Tax=Cupriavidus taiwanensis TaxID=164546 RepID=UPI000E106507|nr:hypothetical protein [Cupriavidus taiwanensis]SOY56873.1 Phage-related tail fibre protein [Cupriavidus taiwanensis]SOY90818.1 Phage-related tail fibre protein [Cupriavidus taiwanensis]SOZ63608.1 Phage-related tail fibre protein [Cupriavidus taiwanensis]SOZ82624.1 Phage-related tail fibre protein [Cupriavidus taiwanensis]SOZ84461.1 Phage-related tail fibre protein [Cupriavidus taiwanensis]